MNTNLHCSHLNLVSSISMYPHGEFMIQVNEVQTLIFTLLLIIDLVSLSMRVASFGQYFYYECVSEKVCAMYFHRLFFLVFRALIQIKTIPNYNKQIMIFFKFCIQENKELIFRFGLESKITMVRKVIKYQTLRQALKTFFKIV